MSILYMFRLHQGYLSTHQGSAAVDSKPLLTTSTWGCLDCCRGSYGLCKGVGLCWHSSLHKSIILRPLVRNSPGSNMKFFSLLIFFHRSSLAIIPQDPFLFSGSLRENLDPCAKVNSCGMLLCVFLWHCYISACTVYRCRTLESSWTVSSQGCCDQPWYVHIHTVCGCNACINGH